MDPNKDTAEEQPVERTLAEELADVLDGVENEELSDEEFTDEAETDEVSDEVESEADEEEQPEESDTDAEESEASAEEEPEVEEEAIEPPQHWASEDKEIFATLPKEGQEFLLRRHKAMEADYTRKTQEIADTKRYQEQIAETIAPYRDVFSRQGMDDVGAIRFLVSWKQYLDQNPQQAIMQLAQDYGVTFQQPQAEEQDEYVDPAVHAVRQELGEVRAQLAQRDQMAQQEQTASIVQQVQAFQDEKDESGNPKHPHFETVKADMAALISAGKANGLDDAYDMAVRLHPDIYDKQIEQRILEKQKADQEAERQKAEQAKREKAKSAKKAASGVRSGSASVTNKPSEASLRDDLDAQLKAAGL